MATETKKYYWLKLKENFFDDKNIKFLRSLPDGNALVIIYLKMQLKSLKTEGFIKYDELLPTCEEELALVLDEPLNLVKLALGALEKMGAVEVWENNTLYMASMQQLIGKESASAERVRKHREKRVLQLVDNKPLQCNNAVTKSNTEIEIEKEIEIRDRDRDRDREIDFKKIIDFYNDTCVSFPRLRSLSEKRKKTIKARIHSGYSYEDFEELFTKAENSKFLKGANNRNWSATFDWLIQDANIAKVLDGNYNDSSSAKSEKNKTDNPFLIAALEMEE